MAVRSTDVILCFSLINKISVKFSLRERGPFLQAEKHCLLQRDTQINTQFPSDGMNENSKTHHSSSIFSNLLTTLRSDSMPI